jgi:non-ribosomal peptide synthetase component E (peptide arylation enzyme)
MAVVPQMPLNATGKIDKLALRRTLSDHAVR